MNKNKEFFYEKLIVESHLDTFGHVNNATYLELYEEARWDFITKEGFGLNEIKALKIGPVILNINISFKKEILNRQKITIRSQTIGMKNKYVMLLRQEILNKDRVVLSDIELEVGLFDLKVRKLIVPTEKWNKAVGIEL